MVRAHRRDELRAFLTERGIGTEIYYPCHCTCNRASRTWATSRATFRNRSGPLEEVLALPIFPELREDEQERVVAAIAEFYSR